MVWPLARLWCEFRVWHPTILWATEWRYGGLERTLESRCSDCGWVRWRKTEYRSVVAEPWKHALIVFDDTVVRTLLSVDCDGGIAMPDDLTLEEARSVIEQLVPHALSRAERQGPMEGQG